MAYGRMQFLSSSLSRITEFTFFIPNDLSEEAKAENSYYKRPMKTLYLLHGFSGIDSDWALGGVAHQISVDYNLAVILPTAGNNFYLNRPGTGNQYGTFVGEEIITYTRKLLGLSEKTEDTLIGGFSMGGFGSMHTALMYPETFGGVIALSSPLVVPFIQGKKPGFRSNIADYEYYREVFGDLSKVESSDANLQTLYQKRHEEKKCLPPLYLACGTEDGLIENNRSIRAFLNTGEPTPQFFYEEGPGVHNWKFWNEYLRRGVEWLLSAQTEG